MKLTCNAKRLSNLLSINNSIYKKVVAKEEWSVIKLECFKGGHIIASTTTDRFHTIVNLTSAVISSDIEKDTTIYVDCQLLFNIVKSFSGEISLGLDGTRFNIYDKKSRYKIPIVNDIELSYTVKLPDISNSVKIQAGELKNIVDLCSGYILKDSYEGIFDSIFAHKGKIYATDKEHGIILTSTTFKDADKIYLDVEISKILSKIDLNIVLNIVKVGGLVQLLATTQDSFEFLFGYNYPANEYPVPNMELIYSMINSEKPVFKAVIDSQEFYKAVEKLTLVSNKVHYGIDVTFDNNVAILKTYDNENVGEGIEQVSVNLLDGNKFNVRMNNSKLCNALQNDKATHLWLSSGDNKPQFLLHNQSMECVKFLMPLVKV